MSVSNRRGGREVGRGCNMGQGIVCTQALGRLVSKERNVTFPSIYMSIISIDAFRLLVVSHIFNF